MKFILCRHTQTDFNAQDRYTSHLDIPLNSIGIEQARGLSLMLNAFNFEVVFSSDLLRATQTAEIIIANRNLLIKTDSRLREVNIGKKTGMFKKEARVIYPKLIFSTSSPVFDFTSIGGESRKEVARRHIDFFNETFNKFNPDSLVLVVGHGTSLRVFLEEMGAPCLLEQGNYQIIDFFTNN